MKLTVVELFAGVGGFRVGLNNITKIDSKNRAIENGKWKFIWANQFEPSTKAQYAFDCYVTRFGKENTSNEDINKVKKTLIPKHSLLVGGFPCQDYSVARTLSNEKGIEGKKGVLFWDIRDILVEKETPFVLLENVDRLLKSPSTKRGKDFAIIVPARMSGKGLKKVRPVPFSASSIFACAKNSTDICLYGRPARFHSSRTRMCNPHTITDYPLE